MNTGWSTREKLVYHNVNVNGCQATNYLFDVYVWFIIFCQTVLEFIILHMHNIFTLVNPIFSFYYILIYLVICNETLLDNHGNKKERKKKNIYCLSKTHPMKECHGLEFRLPLMVSNNIQEGFSKVH